MGNFSLYFVSMTHAGEHGFSSRYVYTNSPERAKELAVLDSLKHYPVEQHVDMESKIIVGLVKEVEDEGIVDFITRKIDANRVVHYTTKFSQQPEQSKFSPEEKVELAVNSTELQQFMDWKARDVRPSSKKRFNDPTTSKVRY